LRMVWITRKPVKSRLCFYNSNRWMRGRAGAERKRVRDGDNTTLSESPVIGVFLVGPKKQHMGFF
jgi:hypothetical protein